MEDSSHQEKTPIGMVTNFSNTYDENQPIMLNSENGHSPKASKEDISIGSAINIPEPIISNIREKTSFEKIQIKLNNIGKCFQAYLEKLSDKIQIQTSYNLFLIFLVLALLFSLISLFKLPFIFFSPGTLLRYLCLSNILMMLSFLFYYGSKDFFAFLTDPNRTMIVLLHLLGVFFGFFWSFTSGYFLNLILDVVLIITTCMFILTLIPGGKNGIEAIKNMLAFPLFMIKNKFFKN